MKKNLLLIALIVCSFAVAGFAQTRSRMNKKIAPVKAGVTVKVKLPAEPSEDDAGIWNDFVSDKYGFRLTFPAAADNVFSDEEESFVHFSASTEKARYALMVKNMLVSLNNSQLDALYESVFVKNQDQETSRLVRAKNVYLNGVLGKELVFEENGNVIFNRVYILESKLFVLTVSLSKKNYAPGFDRWAAKFLDSFGVKTGAKMDS
jgi:hypothetical protein